MTRPFCKQGEGEGQRVRKEGSDLTFKRNGEFVDRCVFLVCGLSPIALMARYALLATALFHKWYVFALELIELYKNNKFSAKNVFLLFVNTACKAIVTIVCAKVMNYILVFGLLFPNNVIDIYSKLEKIAYGDFYFSSLFSPGLDKKTSDTHRFFEYNFEPKSFEF